MRPKLLLIIDGFGALLSFVLLAFVLPVFQDEIGITINTLYFLAAFPLLYLLYDFVCVFFIKENLLGHSLKLVAYFNIVYCLISLSTIFIHVKTITWLGVLYFTIEVMIILILAIIELKVANKLK